MSMFSTSRLATYLVRSARKSIQSRMYCAAQAPLEVPLPDGTPKTYPKHITDIVDQISKLTLMEVADLNSCLKSTLNIQDAPMMAMGMPMAAQAAAPQESEEEVQSVQTLFTVTLDKYDEKKKIAVIKEIKKILDGMNLVQAKKFVESVPIVVKEDLTKEESEELKKVLESAGGSVEIS